MPKARLRKKYRNHVAGTRETAAAATAAAKADDDIPDHVLAQLTGGADPTVAGASKGKALSRGQRKRLLKKQRFLRQMAGGGGASVFMSPAEAKRRAAAQAGLGGVQSLKDVLDTVDTSEVSAPDASAALQPRYVSGKARHKMAMREAAHLSQVSAHPAFLADPLGALQQHLSASLPTPPASEDDVGAGGGSTGDSGAAAGAGAGTGVGAGSSKAPKGSARAAADAAEAAAAAARKQRGRAGGARGRAAAKGKQRHGRAKFR